MNEEKRCVICNKIIIKDEIPRVNPKVDYISDSHNKYPVCNRCGNIFSVFHRFINNYAAHEPLIKGDE